MRIRPWVLLLAGSLLLASAPVRAEAPNLAPPPDRPPGPVAPAPTPLASPAPLRTTVAPVSRTVLPNGMVVLVQEVPDEDIVAVELLVRVGLQQEGSNLAGMTNLIQEILADRITKDEAGEDTVEITGSLVNTTAEPDYSRISLVTTPEHLDLMMDRLGRALRQRSTTTPEVDRARNRVMEAFQGNQGAFSALYGIFLENFYRYHPYKRTPTGAEASVRRMDPQALDPYFQRYFVPNRMVLSISGKVDRVALVERARKEFASLEAVRENTVDIQWEPKASEKEIFLAANSRLAWVFVGFPAPGVRSKDYAAMRLLQGLLGEGLSSRLWTELREKRGLAYELGSMYPELEGPSHVLAYVVTRPNSVGESRRRILGEVDRVKQEGVSSQELEETRRKLMGLYLLERETNKGKAFHLALAETLGIGYEADQDYLRALQAVTPQDVQRVAREYLDNCTLVVARPGGRFYFDF